MTGSGRTGRLPSPLAAALLIGALSWLFVPSATAQEIQVGGGFFYVTSLTGVTTFGVGISFSLDAAQRHHRKVALIRYLRDNAIAVRGALACGCGASLNELAELMGLEGPHRALFAKRLRGARFMLNAALALVDDERMSAAFIAGVRAALANEPMLRGALKV